MTSKAKQEKKDDYPYQETILSSLVDHPQGKALKVPSGYLIDEQGTYFLKTRYGVKYKERVCHYPLILEGYVRDMETGSSMVVIAWLANKEWRRVVVGRDVLAIGSDLARAAAPAGAPISSANSNMALLYLSAFEAANIAHYEEVKGVSRMGWLPKQEAFLIGANVVTENGITPIQSPLTMSDGWAGTGLVFVPTGNEVHRVLAGYHQEGTLKRWTEAARLASEYPLALAGLYVSLLPPLLQILGADNFVWEWSGKSSVGKTTSLALAASIWGQPRMNMDPSIVSSWRVTDVYVERTLASLGDLPLFLDDTRTATRRMKNGVDPVQVVYDVVSGTTKGRGTVSGTEARRAWRTILLSTGEESITGNTEKLGVFARTWSINGRPWGTVSPEAAKLVLEVESIIAENYGVLGPLWIQRIMSKREAWPKWRQVYREIRDQYGTHGAVGENAGLAGRLGKNIAALEVCANLALTLVPEIFTWNFRPMLEDLWRWAQSEGCGTDPILDAIIGVRDWVIENSSKFYPRGQVEPAAGWMGIWPLPRQDDLNPSIYVVPNLLVSKLRELGHPNLGLVLDEWARRGFMSPSARKTKHGSPSIFNRRHVKLNDVQLWVIELRPPINGVEVLEAYDDLTERAPNQT